MSGRAEYGRLGDGELLGLAAEGRGAAFAELLQRHQAAIYGFALRFMADSALAEDVAQETFLRLLSSYGRRPPRGGLRGLLLRMAKNLCIDMARKKSPELVNEPPQGPDDDDPERRALAAEALAALDRAVCLLPENQRAVLLLRHDQGLAYAEIARVMQCSVSAVESLLVRARRGLRRSMADYI